MTPRTLLFFLLIPAVSEMAWSQNVKRSCTYSPPSKVGEVTELIFVAEISPGWILFANDFDPAAGPALINFTFKENPLIQIVGAAVAVGEERNIMDPWKTEVAYFRN